MKKIIFSAPWVMVALLCILPAFNALRAQNVQTTADSLQPLPAEVLKIVTRACFDCHAEPGRVMALTKLNLTKWNNYSAEKKAEKASGMSELVGKGEMPPKKYVAKYPETAVTPEELKILSDWAQRMSGK